MTLPERLQGLRRSRRLSCAKLSDALDCHHRTVEDWMYSGKCAEPAMLQRFADFFFPEVQADQRLTELYRGVVEFTGSSTSPGALPDEQDAREGRTSSTNT